MRRLVCAIGVLLVVATTRAADDPAATSCGAILHNPSGTFEQKNQHLMVYGADRFAFSIIK